MDTYVTVNRMDGAAAHLTETENNVLRTDRTCAPTPPNAVAARLTVARLVRINAIGLAKEVCVYVTRIHVVHTLWHPILYQVLAMVVRTEYN